MKLFVKALKLAHWKWRVIWNKKMNVCCNQPQQIQSKVTWKCWKTFMDVKWCKNGAYKQKLPRKSNQHCDPRSVCDWHVKFFVTKCTHQYKIVHKIVYQIVNKSRVFIILKKKLFAQKLHLILCRALHLTFTSNLLPFMADVITSENKNTDDWTLNTMNDHSGKT